MTRTHHALEDFLYNEEEDHYVCPNGKILRLKVKQVYIRGTCIEHIEHKITIAEDVC